MSGIDTKKKLIDITYTFIKERGVEGVRTRDIANEAGCNVKLLYKYFEDLNYLITLASLRFLEDYNREIHDLIQSSGPALKLNIEGWRIFAKYAFRNPPIYENLFWGKGKSRYADAVTEYFELYRNELYKAGSAYFYSTIILSDIEERDYIWMRRAANEGTLSMELAQYISRMDSLVVHALLLEHMEDYKKPGIAEKAAEECISLIMQTIQLCTDKASVK